MTDDWTKFTAIIGSVTGIAALWVALRGQRVARQQIANTARFEIARKVKRAVHAVEDAIVELRNNFSRRDYALRCSELQAAFAEFDVCKPDIRALLGQQVEVVRRRFTRICNEFDHNFRVAWDEEHNDNRPFGEPNARLDAARPISQGTPDDEFGRKVHRAVDEFSVALTPYLGAKGNWWAALKRLGFWLRLSLSRRRCEGQP